ncbi:MAG: HAMP domain-containing histidine kinase [Gemmatimonadaceae bacterium]|nr:HAMP domain-containing histidine kinase [Gemmatimonadaceae bacterium]
MLISPERDEGTGTTGDRQQQRVQRVAMVGTLAAGLGHDLRNVLMPVMLRLDVLASSPDLPDAARRDVASIRSSVLQLQRLAAGLRLLGSDPFDQADELQHFTLAAWWPDVAPLVADALTAETRVVAEFSDGLPSIAVPPGVVAQLVMSLVMNARRALSGIDAPAVWVRAMRLDEDTVRLEITDNGIGMEEEVRLRCFEPFFTTRPREYATGMGLSTGRSLLRRYGGDLRLAVADAEPGATFHLLLPVHKRGTASDAQTTRTRGVTKEERVQLLLADPRHRTVVRLHLAQRGVRLWEGTPEAVEGRRRKPRAPSTIICDGEGVARVLDDLRKRRHRQPRIIALGTAPTPEAASEGGVVWVAMSQLSTLADLVN